MADYAGEFFKDTLTTILEEKLSNVENQEEADKIIEKIESADLSDLMIKMYSQMAQDTTNFMRKTMFEQVLRFRADELEFMARQEKNGVMRLLPLNLCIS